MVEVYIEIFDEIWTLSPTPVSAIFSSLPRGKEIWVKMMEFYLRFFFHKFILGSSDSKIQELLGAAEGFMIGKMDF